MRSLRFSFDKGMSESKGMKIQSCLKRFRTPEAVLECEIFKGLFKRTQQSVPTLFNKLETLGSIACFSNVLIILYDLFQLKLDALKYLQKKQHKTLFENCCMMLGQHCWVRLNRP